MYTRYSMKLLSGLLIIALAVCMTGCATAGGRNLRETVNVVAGPALAEANVRFILELRQSKTEIALADVDVFLSTSKSSSLSHAVKADLRAKQCKLQKTLAEALAGSDTGLVIARPDQGRPFSDGNIVLYLRGRDGFHVYFSFAEIDRVFAYPAIADDLVTIHYTHPLFEAAFLCKVKESLAKQNLSTPNLALSEGRLEALKTLAAAGILERKLRSLGVPLTGDTSLLASESFGETRSPKLTKALESRDALERILSCGDPDAIRALVYLINANAITLSSL